VLAPKLLFIGAEHQLAAQRNLCGSLCSFNESAVRRNNSSGLL
jgi:hypothetical protein